MTAGLPLPLLAAAEEPLIKLAVGVIVGLIWLGVQIYGALAKKGDQQVPPSLPPKRKPVPPVPRPTRGPDSMEPYAPGTVPPMNRQNAPPMRKSPPMRVPTPPKKKPSQKAPAESRPDLPQPTVRQPQFAPDAKQAPSATRASSRKQTLDGLLKPRNLKKAIVLTEVLGKPVALRPPADLK